MTQPPAPDALVRDIQFQLAGLNHVDLPTLRKNGYAISDRDVRLQGQVRTGFDGDLILTHRAAETEMSSDRVKNLKEGKLDVKVRLMRGRNVLILSHATDPTQSVRLDVFHRSTRREWVDSIVKALVLVLVVKTFVVQAFFIPTESMQNTLLVRDYLLVDKLSFLFRDPKPGEIVVFEYPLDPSKDFIKRLVGAPGDVLTHVGDQLTRNGQKLDEPYARYAPKAASGGGDHRSFLEVKVPPGNFWMMGDNRNNSADSRFWGPLPAWRVIGRAWGIYFPLNRMGVISHRFGGTKK